MTSVHIWNYLHGDFLSVQNVTQYKMFNMMPISRFWYWTAVLKPISRSSCWIVLCCITFFSTFWPVNFHCVASIIRCCKRTKMWLWGPLRQKTRNQTEKHVELNNKATHLNGLLTRTVFECDKLSKKKFFEPGHDTVLTRIYDYNIIKSWRFILILNRSVYQAYTVILLY